jgi:arginase family enzyme
MVESNQVFFRTDDAWDFLPAGRTLPLPVIDVREEAKALRFITSARRVDAFTKKHASDFRPYTLFGSGDFHHMSAVWTRQFREPFTLLSFDNHTDWDIRPPDWSCGAWINRALEMPRVESIAVWGCGNFECGFPSRLLGNRRAAKTHRLLVYPWKRTGVRLPLYLNALTRKTWQTQFLEWIEGRHGHKVYVTIDMDCLVSAESITNWENGRFTCADLVWALRTLREKVEVIGGDLCGAWSQPRYATAFQKLAGWFDHPKGPAPRSEDLLKRNLPVLENLWSALTGSRQPQTVG